RLLIGVFSTLHAIQGRHRADKNLARRKRRDDSDPDLPIIAQGLDNGLHYFPEYPCIGIFQQRSLLFFLQGSSLVGMQLYLLIVAGGFFRSPAGTKGTKPPK